MLSLAVHERVSFEDFCNNSEAMSAMQAAANLHVSLGCILALVDAQQPGLARVILAQPAHYVLVGGREACLAVHDQHQHICLLDAAGCLGLYSLHSHRSM